jgi:hypothetical protein
MHSRAANSTVALRLARVEAPISGISISHPSSSRVISMSKH